MPRPYAVSHASEARGLEEAKLAALFLPALPRRCLRDQLGVEQHRDEQQPQQRRRDPPTILKNCCQGCMGAREPAIESQGFTLMKKRNPVRLANLHGYHAPRRLVQPAYP